MTKETIVKWSFPQIDSYISCPHQYYRTRVLGDVDPVVSELAQVSDSFVESFNQALVDGVVPEKLHRFQTLVEILRRLPGVASVNKTLAVDENFKPCSLDKAWVKSKVHYIKATKTEALLFEWRTGSKEPSDALKLSAALYFCLNPDTVRLQCQTFWFKSRKIDRVQYTRADLKPLLQQFVPLYHRFREAHLRNEWPAQPCGLCKKYCNVKDCKYNGI